MPTFVPCRWVVVAGLLVPAIVALGPGSTPGGNALGDDKPPRPGVVESHAVSYLKEVRPILAQHCFQCHGPDQAARKAKLRLDLKEHALALRKGQSIFAPGNLKDSLAWERLTSSDASQRMPPKGKA